MSSRFSSSSIVYESKPNNINKKLIKVKWICKKKRLNLIIIKKMKKVSDCKGLSKADMAY